MCTATKTSRGEAVLISILAFLHHNFRSKCFTKITLLQILHWNHWYRFWPPCCAVAENVVTDKTHRQTYTETHRTSAYCNPYCACTLRILYIRTYIYIDKSVWTAKPPRNTQLWNCTQTVCRWCFVDASANSKWRVLQPVDHKTGADALEDAVLWLAGKSRSPY